MERKGRWGQKKKKKERTPPGFAGWLCTPVEAGLSSGAAQAAPGVAGRCCSVLSGRGCCAAARGLPFAPGAAARSRVLTHANKSFCWPGTKAGPARGSPPNTLAALFSPPLLLVTLLVGV